MSGGELAVEEGPGISGDEQHGQARLAFACGIGDLPPVQPARQAHVGHEQVHARDLAQQAQRRGAAWFRMGHFWVTRAYEDRRPVRAGFRL